MKYTCTLIAVRDMEKAKQFYYDVLGLEVVADFGANVTLTGGIVLQTVDSWQGFIHKPYEEIIFGNNACELYFEEDDIDAFAAKLNRINNIEYVHPLLEHSWGQHVIRFYDPDKHIIEVGENIMMVMKRFIDTGLSIEETAARMDVPVDYIKTLL
ncbi:MAG: VOC family protein [Dehalobacter sp.]|nr:VOC family protein [Dehalobacter sp.]